MAQENTANSRQVGGDHYDAKIQHWDFVIANHMPYLEAQVFKYVLRWRKKNGITDLDKAAHNLQKLRETAVAEGFDDPKGERNGGATPGYTDQARDCAAPTREGLATKSLHSGVAVNQVNIKNRDMAVQILKDMGYTVHIY